MPGPPKRSNAHKAKNGSRKEHHGEDVAPPLLTRTPDVPVFLKGKKYAMQEWHRVCRLLIEEQILTRWDLPLIKILCSEWHRYCTACDDIDEKGEYMITSSGYEQVRPAHTVRNKAFGNYEKSLQKVGADVVSRSRMKRVRPVEEKKNKFGTL